MLGFKGRLPVNVIMQNPTGTWGFVGRVSLSLLWGRQDGAALTDKDETEIARLASFGGRFVTGRNSPYVSISYATEADAQAAVDALGGAES